LAQTYFAQSGKAQQSAYRIRLNPFMRSRTFSYISSAMVSTCYHRLLCAPAILIVLLGGLELNRADSDCRPAGRCGAETTSMMQQTNILSVQNRESNFRDYAYRFGDRALESLKASPPDVMMLATDREDKESDSESVHGTPSKYSKPPPGKTTVFTEQLADDAEETENAPKWSSQDPHGSRKDASLVDKGMEDDSDLEMLRTLCEHPQPTPDSKKNALVAMAGALNSMDAPYNIFGGTVLGLVRGCYIFDYDLDFVVDRDWLKDNVDKAVSAILGAGFVPNTVFGKIDTPGFERSWNFDKSLIELGSHQLSASLQHAVEMHLGNRTNAISLLHRDSRTTIKADLFTISRTREYYEWGLWLTNSATGKQEFAPCTAKFTHTATFRWFGVDVKIPLPLKDGLISLYGDHYMTPHPWTWNVEPFTIGSCRKLGHKDGGSLLTSRVPK